MTLHQPILSQQHHNWKAARERLLGKPVKPTLAIVAVIEPEQVVEVKTEPPRARPLWAWAEITFDWHIHAWREFISNTISQIIHENAAMRAALQVASTDSAFVIADKRPVDDIVAEILVNFPGITRKDINSHHRTKDIIYPRHLCFYAVVESRPDLSFPQIGRLFGFRDHTTIIYGHKKVSEMTETDHRKHLALQRAFCKKRRKYTRERIQELEAASQ
jgi:chromosomal replication initiator protein